MSRITFTCSVVSMYRNHKCTCCQFTSNAMLIWRNNNNHKIQKQNLSKLLFVKIMHIRCSDQTNLYSLFLTYLKWKLTHFSNASSPFNSIAVRFNIENNIKSIDTFAQAQAIQFSACTVFFSFLFICNGKVWKNYSRIRKVDDTFASNEPIWKLA